MKVGDLVKHKEVLRLGIGLVTKSGGDLCMVKWTYESDDDRMDPGPTLEAISDLEVISASR